MYTYIEPRGADCGRSKYWSPQKKKRSKYWSWAHMHAYVIREVCELQQACSHARTQLGSTRKVVGCDHVRFFLLSLPRSMYLNSTSHFCVPCEHNYPMIPTIQVHMNKSLN
jgi:hypothetical protein